MSTIAALVVDAPRPVPPLYTLIDAPINDSTPPGDAHWAAGIELVGWANLDGGIWPACPAPGNFKDHALISKPDHFDAFTVYLGMVCTSLSFTPDELDQRAQVAFAAYEHYFLERQVWTGVYVPVPHLADANADTVTTTAVGVAEGVGLAEQEIAKVGRQGLIHMSPEVAAVASSRGNLLTKAGNHLETMQGTQVVPCQGYWEAKGPGSATGSWIYATTPFVIRRGPIFVPPWQQGMEVLENKVHVWAERDYAYAWDQTLQAAVQVDVTK